MVSSATGAKNDLKYENLSMSLIPLLEWILDSNWSQKVVQFEVFPSNGEITNFGNLQLTSSTELGGVESWGENVELFSTVDCFKHLCTRAITWKEIYSLLRIFSYSTSYSFGSKRFRGCSYGCELAHLGGLARLSQISPSLRNSYKNIMCSYEKWASPPRWGVTWICRDPT